MRSRPVAALATRSASITASVPDAVNRTFSADGTIDAINSAHSTSSGCAAP